MRITARDRAEQLRIDTDRAGPLLTTARAAVASDALGYGLIIAQRPGEHQQRQHDR